MKKRVLKILVIITALFLVGGIIIFKVNKDLEDLNPIGNKYIETIFVNEHYDLYRVRWGLSGHHSKIILKKKGTSKKIIFEKTIFVEINRNRIIVYSREDMSKYKDEWDNLNLNLDTITRDEFLKFNEKEQNSTFFKVMK